MSKPVESVASPGNAYLFASVRMVREVQPKLSQRDTTVHYKLSTPLTSMRDET